jgi:O-methyltransferase domain
VLHGYSDERAIRILQNCRAVIPASGVLLIIEFVLPDVIPHNSRRSS